MGTAASANTGGVDDSSANADGSDSFIKADSISNWTANRVGVWLMNTCELGQYCEMFYTARINGAVLKDLTDEELEELGIYNRMHRKRIFTEICKQNDIELDELERAVGTPSPRQYWSGFGSRSPRSRPKQDLDGSASSSSSSRKGNVDALRAGGAAVQRDSPKFTLGPGGTPRAWNPNSKPGDVVAHSPKASPFKTVASVNLFEALDDVEAQQKRRHAKWYANKVVEKSLVAMRAALKTARGMAVLQAEARYHGSIEAARETLMHNTRLQARQKAIEDFYSGNWRHKGVSPMAKYANRGMSVDEQVEAAMRDELEEKKRQQLEADTSALIGSAALYADTPDSDEEEVRRSEQDLLAAAKRGADEDSADGDDGDDGQPHGLAGLGSEDDNTDDDDEVGTPRKGDNASPPVPARKSPRILRSVSSIRRKYDAPLMEGKYDGGNRSPGELLVDSLLEDDEEDEEERALFAAAAKRGLHLRQLITTKKRMLHEARDRGDTATVLALQRELAELQETSPRASAAAKGPAARAPVQTVAVSGPPPPPPRRSSRAPKKIQRKSSTDGEEEFDAMAAAVAEADALRARRETKRQKNASESKQAAIDDDAAAAATASLSAEAASKSPDLSPVAGDVAFLEQKTFKINDEAVESVLSQVEQLGAAGAAAKLKEMKHKTLEPTASSTSVMSTNSLYDVPADRFDVKSIQVKPPNMSGVWARTGILSKERGRVFFSTLNRCERALAARGSHLVSDMGDLKNFKRTISSTSGEDPDPQTGGINWDAARHFMVIQQQSHRVTLQQTSKGKLNTFASMQVGDSERVPFLFYNEVLSVQSKWIPLDRGHAFCAKDKANLIAIPRLAGGAALVLTFKSAMKSGSLKQQKVLSMLLYVEPGPSNEPADDVLHVMYSAVERSSLHLTFKRLPQEQLRPLRKQWKYKSKEKFVFLKNMKDTLPRSVDEVGPSTLKRIEEAKRVVRAGLVGLGPTLLPVLIPSQAYDVILHDITKNRFDIMCDNRVVLDSSEADLRELNSEVTLKAMRRELQAALPNLTSETFQNVMDPIFQALNVTRHTQAAFQYFMSIFQDSLQIWFRPVSSTQALLENCPNAMDDSELKVLGVAIDQESSTIYVQSKIPFEILLRQWCYPESSSEHQTADNGWVFLLPVAAIVTEGISFSDEDLAGSPEQNICVRLQAMD